MGELITNLDGCLVYKVKNDVSGCYYLCIPSDNMSSCQLYLEFYDKEFDDIFVDDIISMMRKFNDEIRTNDKNSIYVLPEINMSYLNQLTNINDTRDYMNFVNEKIHPIIYEVHEMITKNNMKEDNISQDIIIITKNDVDKKIAGGLSLCPSIGAFIKEIDYVKLNSHDNEIDLTVVNSNIDLTNSTVGNNKDNENKLVRVRKKDNTSLGFSSFKFIIATLVFSLVVGVLVGYLIIK